MAGPYKTDVRPVRLIGAEPLSRKVSERKGAKKDRAPVAIADTGAYWAVQEQASGREYALRSFLDRKWAAISPSHASRDAEPSLSSKGFDGRLLRHLCGRPLRLKQFLPLSVSVAEAVTQMHASGLVHLRISPDSLLVGFNRNVSGSPGSGRCRAWLTGFGFAQRIVGGSMADDEQTVSDAAAFAYLSPEQMGMPHHRVDVRADLYALGCVFYELLTGSPPFAAKDPTGWAHAHIAKRPRSVRSRRPSVPDQIDAIVMKLLEKAPGERYQSAASLRADLERCWRMCRRSGSLETFPLNLHDIPDRLARSDRLYGQEGNVKRLDDAFQQAKRGAAQCVFVCGAAGSGKSSLANEQLLRLGADLCRSAASKCEPATHKVPYGSLSQALDNLVRPLLGESDAGFESWRARLQAALGSEGCVLFPLVPVLERIVGDQPPLPRLPRQAERDRFLRAVAKLLGAFACAERPVVLFIDDLQWSDDGTVSVLEYIARHAPIPHLLIIGSLRVDDVAVSSSLYALAHDKNVEVIALQSLTLADVAALLSDLLHEHVDRLLPLGRLIVEKTNGNPFFVNQFISALSQEGLIRFRTDGDVVWDATRIAAKGFTHNVVDLLLRRIESLPVATRELMHVFSCLGRSAAANTLALAANVPVQIVHDTLSAAVNARLVQRFDDSYAFAHDRILETAYGTLSDENERAAIHLQIGRRLGALTSEAGPDSPCLVYEVVNHLNRAIHLINLPEERAKVGALNLQAGLQAKRAMAYSEALGYLRFAVAALLGNCDKPGLQTAAFHLAECEFVTGHMDEAEARLSALARQSVDLPFGAEITRLRAAVYTARDRSDLAIEVGLQYLRRVGIDMPMRPGETELQAEYARLVERLRSRTFDACRNQAEMRDPVWRGVVQVLADLIPPALFTAANLPNLIALHMTHISLEHGVTDASCYGYICASEVFRRYGDYTTCYAFGELALHLVDTRGFDRYKARVHMFFGVTQSWRRPVREALPHLQRACDEAMQAGDLTFAAYCRRNLISPMLAYGAPLAETQQLAYESLAYARGTKFDLVIDAIRAQVTYIDTLRGAPQNEAWWTDDEASRNTNRPISVFSHWTHRMQAHLLFGNLTGALDAEERASRLLWSSSGHYETALFVLFSALVHAAACRSAVGSRQARHLEMLRFYQQKLDTWASSSPHNFRDGATLVAAEVARLEQRVPDAIRLYEEAIGSARAEGFLNDEALASELAAQFHAELGSTTSAWAYLRNARRAYAAWGADAKVATLDAASPELALPDRPEVSSGLINQLDVGAVVTATHALSREIVLERLVETLMRCTLEHAGGQRCVLVTMQADVLQMEAEAQVHGESVNLQMRSGASTSTDLPLALVRSVMRTGEMLVLHDARENREWSGDAYIRATRPRSVLCLPLLNQSRLVGLLYLENNLVAGAFTVKRSSILGVLSTHAAISLENARLYEQLVGESARREQVAERLRTTQAELARVARLTTMGELVASIVHEINQPLTSINTSANAALRWLNRDTPEVGEACAALTRVAADTTRAATIVRGLLSLAKKSPPEMKRFDLNQSIREVLQLLHREISHHEVDLDDRCVAGEQIAHGDRVQLQQVVLNLVVNAIEAMSDSRVALRNLQLSTELDVNGRIIVSVTDTGPGISQAVLGKIFEPFVTTKDTGLGMGLSICRSIIDVHGGELTAVPNSPHGTRFQFTIPTAS
jgi:predicted ATPase/signal transduction histidine kinase